MVLPKFSHYSTSLFFLTYTLHGNCHSGSDFWDYPRKGEAWKTKYYARKKPFLKNWKKKSRYTNYNGSRRYWQVCGTNKKAIVIMMLWRNWKHTGICTYDGIHNLITGFIGRNNSGQLIESTDIAIKDSSDFQFITRNEILRILNNKKFTAKGRPVSEIALSELEGYILENRIVKKVEAYITEPGILHIDIWQKNPFPEGFQPVGAGILHDRGGNIIPLSDHFSPYLLVVQVTSWGIPNLIYFQFLFIHWKLRFACHQ